MRALLWLVLVLLAAACSGSTRREPEPVDVVVVPEAEQPPPAPAATPGPTPSSEQVPVTAQDATWGSPTAPVTIVEFADLQCPFSARVQATLAELMAKYGEQQLRIVFKHHPLPFHALARPAAEWAEALRALYGDRTFFRFVARVFADRGKLNELDGLEALSQGLDVDPEAVRERLRAGEPAAKVAADVELAQRLGRTGTPSFLINGTVVSGAQPSSKFEAVIDAELRAVAEQRSRGVPPAAIYAARVAHNFQPPTGRASPATEKDDAVWRVPIDRAPARGPSTAPVTIVAFIDYQCPFCKRAWTTLDELEQRYPGQLRFVFRQNPLSFHPRARAAAELALEAHAQRGMAAFLDVSRRMFEQQTKLDDAALEQLARQAGLDAGKAMRAVHKQAHRAAIEADQELAEGLQATSTPHFFVNGRRLAGAQPLATFAALIDRELAAARELQAKGVHDVYAAVMASATAQVAPFEHKQVAAPPADQPSRGPAKAPVVIQEFAGFQCPFSKRVQDTLRQLEREFPGKIRLVWRNMPLPLHKHGRVAAAAALEARALGGNAAFWKMHDALFAHQADPDAFGEANLRKYAQIAGVNPDRVIAATRDGRHDAAIDADIAAAQAATIIGTPAFVINGIYVSGAQPLAKFRRALRAALAGK